MEAYFDPPITPPLKVKAANTSACSMLFRGTVCRAPLIVATDSMASHIFIHKSFVDKLGIVCTPVQRPVELANGSFATVTQECKVSLQVHGAKRGEIFYLLLCPWPRSRFPTASRRRLAWKILSRALISHPHLHSSHLSWTSATHTYPYHKTLSPQGWQHTLVKDSSSEISK